MAETQQDIKQQVASLIRETRKAKGLTQKELGDMIGVAESTFNRFEKGSQNLTLDTLQRISAALGVSLFIDFR